MTRHEHLHGAMNAAQTLTQPWFFAAGLAMFPVHAPRKPLGTPPRKHFPNRASRLARRIDDWLDL